MATKYSYLDLSPLNKEQQDWGKAQLLHFIKSEGREDFRDENFTKYMDLDFSKYLSFILIFKGHKKDLQRNSTEELRRAAREEMACADLRIPAKGLTKNQAEDQTGELTGFASARLMPKWPNTVARVFNRLYISKDLRLSRFGHFNKARLDRCYEMSLPLYQNLLSACKNKGIQLVLTTRENTGAKVNSISTVQQMLNRFEPLKKWEIHANYIQTCKDSSNSQCWQRATFRPLCPYSKADILPLLEQLPSLSQEEYSSRFC